ncbi:chitin-binding protein [Streptomyces sp. DvalAA-14]|uniref:lytic polysaccharide monooxygenase auxiliary activity family 9 protein n=1 Tax=unclassified Streptomyces TaxID=2593676 RepID=UPI00081B3260|nr:MULTISPECIES: lytic polysaccharide monooxygenase [unclassified Streptomyces]MYS22197.1 chitin-binding protein [Streptomyces sp. SID4948]SCE10920.1 chitin-binding protein [Streptomyces sp. DvalAA-14]
MSVRRTTASLGAVGAAALLIGAFAPGTASAHGALSAPVSRISGCYAEGPENPKSQVCKDLVADSGTQPLYDWNEVNIANANGQSRTIIPDGHLCSANRDKYRALDWARTDWPATAVAAGSTTVTFRVTAPHKGTMTLYITNQGYDPTKPLKWSDLATTPIATYTTAASAPSGYYTFPANLPARTGRQLIYQVWQRSDSPEAFYGCADVVFGQTAAAAADTAFKAPTDAQIAAGESKSTVSHHGHGGTEPIATSDAADAAPSGATLEAALSASAVLASGALGLLFWSRRKAGARAGS